MNQASNGNVSNFKKLFEAFWYFLFSDFKF
jgi:hypothetical protein